MKHRPLGRRAFTLLEILIATILLSMVFAGSISVYLSSLKFLQSAQSNDISAMPVVSLEGITKVISFANGAGVTGAGKQLDIQADYPTCGDFTTSLNTPSVPGDDQYWHYRYSNNALRFVCDGVAGTNVNINDPILIPNVDTPGSTFALINPSGQGVPTVVQIHLVTTSPAGTLDTNVSLGAASKNP